ncbi:hypothetical protein SAMN05216223_119133 [Actinacidiphila yanglinensis]|uniref:DUF3099 domain-containing protein n=2 Tax=Actinacidiphila yanglinensis TaxID=310779 RepID=A0A1H6DU33_9ACTN|nr:hypothetical protein SAMN05216223_119133 [Actinacidiphila yanglinensis]
MMGTCVVFFVLAWSVVRLWSVPAAIGMCLFAMVIPPFAAIVANRKGPEDRWWDEKDPGSGEAERKAEEAAPEPDKRAKGSCGDPQSDAWWAELDQGHRRNRRD